MNPRQQKRKKYLDPGTIIIIKQVFWGVLVFSTVAALITATWYGTRISAFTISEIKVSGGITIDKEGVKKRVEEQLSGTYFRLIPKRFAFLYPEETIFNNINQVDRIKNVQVERMSGKELYVSFDEYIPDALWCTFSEPHTCLFMDETGYAFAAAPTLSGESLVRYFKTESEPELHNRPFEQSDFESTKEFVRLLSQINWYITKIEIDSARDVFYTLAHGGEVKATLTEAPTQTFSNLETILQSKEFSHLTPGNFQYVDLRFGTRVFVNEELEIETATSTATTTESSEAESAE